MAEATNCAHIKALHDNMFLDSSDIVDLLTGKTRVRPVLRRLKEGRDGRLSVTRDWMEVLHCPLCGAKVSNESKE